MKKEKRKEACIIFSIFIILLMISIISAGIFDSFKKTITGKPTGPQPQDISITVAGINPVSVDIQETTFPDVDSINPGIQIDPTEADTPTPTPITFDVRVNDPDGINDIDDSNVNYEVSRGATTKNGNCPWQSDIDGNTAEYQCSFQMNYWEEVGDWNVEVTAVDFGNQTPQTDTVIFTYRLLSAMTISPATLTWPAVIPGSTNQMSDNDPTIVTNTGNYDGQVLVLAYDLVGETNPSELIPSEDFTVGLITGAEEECNAPATATAMGIDGTTTSIAGSNSNPSSGGTEELYYCIPLFPSVPSQVYSTAGGGSWTVLY